MRNGHDSHSVRREHAFKSQLQVHWTLQTSSSKSMQPVKLPSVSAHCQSFNLTSSHLFVALMRPAGSHV